VQLTFADAIQTTSGQSMNKDHLRLVRIYSSTSPMTAHLIRNYLEDNGIEARVSGDGLAHSGLTGVGSVEVYAFENQAAEALELLNNFKPEAED
jgi:hypothetical protein